MLRTSCRSVEAPVGVFFVITTVMRGERRERGSVCSVEFRVWKVPYWPSSDIFGDFGQGLRGGVFAVGGGGTDKPWIRLEH